MKRKYEVSELIFKIIAYVFLIIFSLICIYPLIYALSSAFSSKSAVDASQVVLWPVGSNGKIGFSIEAFKYVIVDKGNDFWIAYANTLFMCGIGTVWCMVYTILGAYALSKKRLLGRKGFNFFLVFTMWFSAGIIPQAINYSNTGNFFASLVGRTYNQIDLKWLVIIAMGMNATNLILLRNSFEGVPSEIEEAARIDGATEMQVLFNVFIPMSKATLATIALFFGISRWNGYFWAAKVMPDQKYSWPVQVFIRNFIEKETALVGGSIPDDHTFESQTLSELSVVYAMVICGVIPILIIYPFIQKYFAKGVNMGGVKE
ncbi:MAG: carbohydrate ABC transporter permease [Clostridia bacterium]|nr:carbohydrate ABC transporter permease [Clostridia bacterium]MDE6791268.1 carbohydrate ABC transporter permease [Clostridia bacterium]